MLNEQLLLKQIFCDSANYLCKKNALMRIICRRENYTDDFKHILQNIETYMQQGEILKSDVTTTLIKIKSKNKNIVIKRFNTKNLWHRITRSLRRSRASKCWENAHRLLFHQIATPQPLAIIEKKSWWLREKTYYLMEYIAGTPLDIYLNNNNNDQEYYINKLINIFKFFKQQHIRYRDPKTMHFLVANHDLYLLDLDDMQKLPTLWYFLTSAWKKDYEKLIKYWNKNPKMQNTLREKLCPKTK
ncbi:MAG: lipopolysaccharide kinase InaA family protein [Gammaproteobacteria bacterium]|jgi:hypothetical protein